jgi:O-antigen ligase/polysaccharide polymerase Wzy-like membrane protein
VRKALFVLFLVYIVLLVTRPQEFVPALQQTPVLQITLLGCFFIWLATPGKGLRYPQFALLVPFLMVAWIGMGLSGWWGGIVKILNMVLPPIFLFLAATGAIRSVLQLRVFMWVLVACACVLVLHGHWQLRDGIGWSGAEPIEGRITYSGIFNDPNDMGLLFVVCIGSVLYLFGTTTSRIAQLAIVAALGWLLYGVYLTDSRGTMLGTLAVIGFHVWRRFGSAALVGGAAVAIPVLLAWTRLAEMNAEEASAEGRLDAWYEGIQLLLQYPFFGVGFSNFADHHELTAHNSLVLAMAELGLVGYPIWLAFVGYSGYMLHQLSFGPGSMALSEVSDGTRAEVAASRALYAASVGFAVGAFFLSQSYKFMLFLMCGLAVGRFIGASEAAGPRWSCKISAAIIKWPAIAFASIVFLWIGLKVLL